MKRTIFTFLFIFIACPAWLSVPCHAQVKHHDGLALGAPRISGLTYDDITQTGVTIYWTTDTTADSRIKWMVADSNYQPLIFTDSLYVTDAVKDHAIPLSNLRPGTIYKYRVFSANSGGVSIDSGYFVSQSASTGIVEVYFNNSVDTAVSRGENANGMVNFETMLLNLINKSEYSIDIALWEFSYYNTLSEALIAAKNRGVKVRFIYTHAPNTPIMDAMAAHGIPIIRRNYDTVYAMHNKFWIFDYRYNNLADRKYLCTGSANVSHAMFHSDRNNAIVIQDESLCAIYNREFEEMWGSHGDLPDTTRSRFGPQKVNNVPHILNVGGTRMEVYFSPTDSVSAFLENLIRTKTTQSLFFCILKFGFPSIENTLHAIFNQGRQLCGVFDSSLSVDPSSAYPRMKGMAVPGTWDPHADVFIDTATSLMHHKYLIIDANAQWGNKITSTGSFNWEQLASLNNDDNSLTIFDNRVNNLYYQEFMARYKESGGKVLNAHAPTIEGREPGLLRIYPNPFTSSTTLSFELKGLGPVRFVIFDALGHELQTFTVDNRGTGWYDLHFNGSNLSPGVYYCRMTAGGYSTTGKMIIVTP